MNALRQTADTLRNGWCQRKLHDGDKFCAVGALVFALTDKLPEKQTIAGPYHLVDESLEGRVLAEVIKANYDDLYVEAYANPPSEIIFIFNDKQETVEPVIQMIEKAAIQMEENVQ